MSGVYRRQSEGRFFAAGEEFERALAILGDGAFKVYAWACLHADRASGQLAFERADLARRLGKSRSGLGRHLRELVRSGVCALETAPNQHRRSLLRVQAPYWPYATAGPQPPESAATDEAGYVATVREVFLAPACVQTDFGPADERLARSWQAEGVDLTAVRRAILLGSVRKQMSLLGREPSQPIRSLQYFEPLLREVQGGSFPPAYWQHLEHSLRQYERDGRKRADAASVDRSPLEPEKHCA